MYPPASPATDSGRLDGPTVRSVKTWRRREKRRCHRFSPPVALALRTQQGGLMKAVVYNGPRQVSVVEVPDPSIEQPGDVLVRITTTNICGSDLHMYEGRTDFEPGRTLGHENLGEVVEVGSGVEQVMVGDMVS